MFRIGEFSLIAQVSGRLLRYYDEMQARYRYDCTKLLPRLNRILV